MRCVAFYRLSCHHETQEPPLKWFKLSQGPAATKGLGTLELYPRLGRAGSILLVSLLTANIACRYYYTFTVHDDKI